MWDLFCELQRYVGFTDDDEAQLRTLVPLVEPHAHQVADRFYERILEHPTARQVLTAGEHQIGALKVTLERWLLEVFTSKKDAAYVERRARIGRVHVRIGLPQHYMVSAMTVVRTALDPVLAQAADPSRARAAVQRILDLDLALMLHTYKEDMDAQKARGERLATYGSLVGSIGHELRNPLGVIETSLYVLKGRATTGDERVTKHLERIGEQVRLANDIITKLLDLIRDRPLAKQPTPLGPLVREALAAVPPPKGVSVSAEGLDLAPTIQGDPIQLRAVLVNLLENAVQAVIPQGVVRVAVERVALEAGPGVKVTVEDSGPGLDKGVLPRLFEPLVTTKVKGIGLGLALVKRIVDRHRGTITAGRGALGGARFIVQLPEVQP